MGFKDALKNAEKLTGKKAMKKPTKSKGFPLKKKGKC